MTKDQLLEELTGQTYAILKPSLVHGIGVFAIRDIPKGCRNIFSKGHGQWIKVPIAEVERLPLHSKNLVETYCVFDEENYFVPDYGFKVMDMVNYLNHSSSPNITSINDGEDFEALTDIPAGSELLINYEHIVEDIEKYEG
ncbi:MAG: SET domain-containing protein [Chitinophagaceae bacterium]|nr:SET domain-containing protein [Chitinophagaceae bacterium]